MSRSAIGGLLALALFAAAASARADNAGDALQEVDRGIVLFKARNFAPARVAFERAHQLMPDKPNPLRWLGVVDAALGRCAEAVAEINAFLELVPGQDPRVVEVAAIRDRCREELARVGVLVIETTPPAAEVRLDNESGPALGETPYRGVSTPIGEHTVYLRKAGFGVLAKKIRVDGAKTMELDVTLLPLPTLPRAVDGGPPAPDGGPPAPDGGPHAVDGGPQAVAASDGGVAPRLPANRLATGGATSSPSVKKKRPYWIIGVIGGVVVLGVVAAGLGVGISATAGDNEKLLPPIGF